MKCAVLFDAAQYSAVEGSWLPDGRALESWVQLALSRQEGCEQATTCEISASYADEEQMQALNLQYRDKDSATNVLSFPAEMPAVPGENGELIRALGDIVLCPSIIEREAATQGKALEHHWAHMVIHGSLHLLGMDHIDEKDADTMESTEIQLLSELGISNPYLAAPAKCNE